MKKNYMSEKGVLKNTKTYGLSNAYNKALKVMLGGCFAMMVGCFVAGTSGALMSGSLLKFQDTPKYQEIVEAEKTVAEWRYEDNEITKQEFDEKVEDINSIEHTEEIMDIIDKNKYAAYNVMKGGMYLGIGGIGAGFAVFSGAAAKAYCILEKSKDDEDDENNLHENCESSL